MDSRAVVALCALSGVLTALAFPPHGRAFLAWVGMVPAFLAIARATPHGAILGGFVFGIAQEALLLTWFFGVFGGFAFVPLFVYIAWYAILFGFTSRVVRHCGEHALLWAAPVMWVAVEFVRSELFPIRFAWFGLGLSQHANLPVLQAASVVGAYGLSLAIALANAALAWAMDRFSTGRCFGALAVTVGVWGLHAAGRSIPTTEAGDVRIVGIQGEAIRLDEYLQASVEALRGSPGARLVVWPEYAIGKTLTERSAELETVRAFAGEWNVPVLFGAARGRTSTDFENTLYLVGSTGVLGTQVKSEPIPFFADGHAAKGREPLTAGGMSIGAAICYDLDFPYVSRELVAKGAQVLVFPTMDAEPWGEVEHLQHATIAPFRAVEHRRWVVRVASSGISQVVDPYGEVRLATPIGKRAILPADVRLSTEETPYDRGGWLLPHVCLGVAALLVVIAGVRERRASRVPA